MKHPLDQTVILTNEEIEIIQEYANKCNITVREAMQRILKSWCISYPITKHLMEQINNVNN